MRSNSVQALNNLLRSFPSDFHYTTIADKLNHLNLELKHETGDLIALYEDAIPFIENCVWSSDCNAQLLAQYQSVCREMESHIAGLAHDPRHHFVIVIPVADRPLHLKTCLNSIVDLCESFNYGGRSQQFYKKVSVVIADDSQAEKNIQAHRKLAEEFSKKGLATKYLGADEQFNLVIQMPGYDNLQAALGKVEKKHFYHKGASITRNITYLYLKQNANNSKNTLFYFIDSDQEFKLNNSIDQKHDVVGLNMFYHLDRLFTKNDIKILTGKVVGDPPVSPSVMAGKFLDDILDFIPKIASFVPESRCLFHNKELVTNDDAAYHDMAGLFGFTSEVKKYIYACPQTGEHNNISCFVHFADQLQHFFDGEHPTRHMVFQYKNIDESLAPARTVYTGNYVITPEMLGWFIPFANLKLRMAGPVLGRLLRAVLGEKFVSANLPMLHKRTVEEKGQSEYRPGIRRADDDIDLSGEFERQFFGDVMLFTIDELTNKGYPSHLPDKQVVLNTILEIEDKLLHQYTEQHKRIVYSLEKLSRLFNKVDYWWNNSTLLETSPELSTAVNSFRCFIANMETNFGNNAITYQRIQDDTVRNEYRERILEAIFSYPALQKLWRSKTKVEDH